MLLPDVDCQRDFVAKTSFANWAVKGSYPLTTSQKRRLEHVLLDTLEPTNLISLQDQLSRGVVAIFVRLDGCC